MKGFNGKEHIVKYTVTFVVPSSEYLLYTRAVIGVSGGDCDLDNILKSLSTEVSLHCWDLEYIAEPFPFNCEREESRVEYLSM